MVALVPPACNHNLRQSNVIPIIDAVQWLGQCARGTEGQRNREGSHEA